MFVDRLAVHEPRVDPTAWPFCLPVIRQLQAEPLRLTSPVTLVVGENGSGKSTLIEALAERCGFDARGGHGGRKYDNAEPRSVLAGALHLHPHRKAASQSGFFLRAETAKGVLEYMSDAGVPGYGTKRLEAVSHGESYLEVFAGRFGSRGLYLMDEPESGLSFQSTLQLILTIRKIVGEGGQVICATHSPLLTAIPDAQLLVLDSFGYHDDRWESLELVQDWRHFITAPDQFMRNLW